MGQRVGVPWLGWTDGECSYCRAGNENLCPKARFTGYTLDGGYAEFTVADERFCVPIPESYSDAGAAPLLCAGLIGYRSLVRAGDAKRLGIYGFGATRRTSSPRWPGIKAAACTPLRAPVMRKRSNLRRGVGAAWAGASDARPPEELDAAIIFAPVGALVPAALAAVRKGGTVVCGGIHMSDIPSFPYELLWGERSMCSVANLTRQDAAEFMDLAPKVPVRTTTQPFALEQANEALNQLRSGKLQGAAVLMCQGGV